MLTDSARLHIVGNMRRIIAALVGLALIVWPFAYDQGRLGCHIAPTCYQGERPASFIIFGSILIGSIVVASSIFTRIKNMSTQLLLTLIVGSIAGGFIFAVYYMIAFQNNFQF